MVTILAIDDNEDNLELLRAILEDRGYEIVTALSGKEGVSMAKDNMPNLVLLDIMMPEMDGYQTLRVLKDQDETRSIPVIMVTAKTDGMDVRKALEMGAYDYVKKPFNEEELIGRVASTIKVVRMQESLKEKGSALSELSMAMYNRNEQFMDEQEDLISANKDLLDLLDKVRKLESARDEVIDTLVEDMKKNFEPLRRSIAGVGNSPAEEKSKELNEKLDQLEREIDDGLLRLKQMSVGLDSIYM